MSTATTTTALTPSPSHSPSPARMRRHTGPGYALNDALAITWRNLLAYVRLPQLLIFSTIQPTIFVLMFRYVFGGSMEPALAATMPGVDYVNYLIPGIFVQTVAFGAMATGIGLADDAQKGLIERFRSLPMARSAVLAGRTIADGVRNILVVILMTVIGLLVGFRPEGGVIRYVAALGLVLLFSYALSWVVAAIGLSVPTPETAQAAVFPLIAPLTFASSAFVVPSLMPGWLQVFANYQPVTITVNAVRRLVLDQPLEQYALGSVAWSLGILAVFAPLAVRQYRRVG